MLQQNWSSTGILFNNTICRNLFHVISVLFFFVNTRFTLLKNLNVNYKKINTLRTGDADLRFYITTVQDG